MELWIRSQDKKILQKTDALFISHTNENVWSICENQNFTKYGTYKTEEKALEVLDEIQNIIMPKAFFGKELRLIPPKTEIIQLEIYVYEMPEE